ncbi:MAG: ATP-binding cassette domain-containing protein [Firmicutes bacterium]|nr:ATP-binding cassette domain-containing protein [Bacillota bacterium]
MSILEIKNLSHLFDSKPLFENASLAVNKGEHIGVVGLNGAGKSTFVNIIAGKLIQDSGEIKWNSATRRGYLDQHADIGRNQTIMEYLLSSFAHLTEKNDQMEKMYARMGDCSSEELEKLINKTNSILEYLTEEGFFDLSSQIKKVANGLGVGGLGYDTSVFKLSGGQRAKLMLAKLLLEKPDMMLLDEPTNFLDIEHIDWLTDYLANYSGTYLIISHDTAFLDKVCKAIISIENGQIKKYYGNYTQYRAQAEQNAKQYEDSYHRQQEEIEKMKDYIARNSARAATAGMANSRKKMLDKIDIIRKPTVVYDAEFRFPYSPLHTKDLLVIKGLQIGYSADKPLLPPINMHLNAASKVWIRGTNGIGKTTLIKTLTGNLAKLSGSVVWHAAASLGYLEQDIDFGRAEHLNASGYMSDKFFKMNVKEIRAALAGVGIKNELALKSVAELSGGEQVRVRLCALMQKNSNVLLLDEPTNHLDTRAKEALKAALKEYQGCLVLVSHERDFAEQVCTEVFDAKCEG